MEMVMNGSIEPVFEPPAAPPAGSLWWVPLGGVGEIGKNMMFFRYQDDILVVDAGFMFPKEEMLGVDLVINDTSYLLENRDKVRGIVLTHGHEDHIGGLAYIIEQLAVPVYGTELTLGILKGRLREFDLLDQVDLRVVKAGGHEQIGNFAVEFFRVIHSISEGVGLAIRTPVGLVVHSGDFKFDQTPVDGKPADISRLAELGHEGVLLLLSDSTYADRPGHSAPERLVGHSLEQVFRACPGRIIITTFASSIPRIQQIINVARAQERSICVVGRSLTQTISVASELGYLDFPASMQVQVEEIEMIPDRHLAILTTGSQGEPMSALSLMATCSHKWVRIKEGDTVVLSATPVPGNEALVMNIINLLFRLGADVIYSLTPKSSASSSEEPLNIHVPGHASQEELKMLIGLVRPRCFAPIHGEYRHMVHHARLAREMGVPAANIFRLDKGEILELTSQGAKLAGRVPCGDVLVDGLGIGDVGRIVLRDRQHLSEDGIFIVVAGLAREDGQVLNQPELLSRGFVYEKDFEPLFDQVRELVSSILEEKARGKAFELAGLQQQIRSEVGRLLYAHTRRRPIVVPVLLEV